jgi:hypothetical protein
MLTSHSKGHQQHQHMTPDEVNDHIASRISHADMASFSALSYGAAGVCLGIVLLLAQIWATPPKPLHLWSVGLAALAMPLFLAVAVFDQIWHSLKLPYLALQRVPRVNMARAATWYFAQLCLLVSVDCVLFGLSLVAGSIFTGLAVAMPLGVYLAFRHAGSRALLAELSNASGSGYRDPGDWHVP